MDKSTIEKLKTKLIAERQLIEGELLSFAHRDPIVKGDWDTDFPSFGDERTEQDENANEVEEYTNELPVEYALETRLESIDEALDNIEVGKYGICEVCGHDIEIERLEVEPSARTHVHCK